MRKLSTLSAAVALVLLSACANSRDIEGLTGGASGCIGCHGGRDNQTGAPPFDVAGLSSSAAVGAHTAHLDAGVRCDSCHVVPTQVSFPKHQNGVADVTFGAVAFDPAGGTTPTYDGASHTCSNVYCHSASTLVDPNIGTPGKLDPLWNAPAGSISGCGACHKAPAAMHGGSFAVSDCAGCHPATIDGSGNLIPGGAHLNKVVDKGAHAADWASGAVTTAHGLAATYQDKAAYPNGIEGCKRCHGSALNNPPIAGIPSCDLGCHTGGGAAWRTDCTFCHGDAGRTLATQAAPPRDAAGRDASAKVGAHQVHLTGKATNTPRISNGVACSDCHGGTTRALPSGSTPLHFDGTTNGTTEVTLKRPTANAATGTYDPATGTCSATWCHGSALRIPKTPANNPSWSATSGQAACDSCHSANGALCGSNSTCADAPTALHEAHRCARCHGNNTTTSGGGRNAFALDVGCFACHPAYQRQLSIRTGGTVPPAVNLAIHVDGVVEVVGTTSSSLYQNFNLTLTYTPPSGNTPPSCTTNCHGIGAHSAGPSGSASWQ